MNVTAFHLRRSICLLKKRKMITSLGEPVRQRDTVTTNRSFVGRCTNYCSVTAHRKPTLWFARSFLEGNYSKHISARPAHHATSLCVGRPARSHRISCVVTKNSDFSCQHPDRDSDKAETQTGTECAGPSSSARFPAQTMGSITCR